MPIIGMTKNNIQIAEGLPIIGKLMKGDEKKGNRPGSDLDHFRFKPSPEFALMEASNAFMNIYGNAPRLFENVFLVTNDVDEAFSTWMEWWTAGETLRCRHDGETVFRWYDDTKMKYKNDVRPATREEKQEAKQVGRLNLLLPELCNDLGVIGVVTAETHSKNDIVAIHSYLTMVTRLYGKLTGVPFMFGRVHKEISTPGWARKDGGHTGRQMASKSLFTMHVMPDFTREHMLPAIQNHMLAVEAKPQITAPPEPPTRRFDLPPIKRSNFDDKRREDRRLTDGAPQDDEQPDVEETLQTDEPEKELWLQDKDKRMTFLKYAVSLGLVDDVRDAPQFIYEHYYADRTIESSDEITDDFESAMARLEIIATQNVIHSSDDDEVDAELVDTDAGN